MAEWIAVHATSSDAGKTTVAAALCSILSSRGYDVAPFKPVNYSLNAFPVENSEIAYAQYFQSRQAGCEVSKDLNPVLVKTMKEKAEVAADGYHDLRYDELDSFIGSQYSYIREAVERLDQEYDYVVMEGFGSFINSNLGNNPNIDLLPPEAKVILVSDISRGGVESSVAGCLSLLPGKVSDAVERIIINKARASSNGMEKTQQFLEEETGVRTHVLHHHEQLSIPAEDAIPNFYGNGEIAVVNYPHTSNTSDLWRLPPEKTSLIREPEELDDSKLVILPGSKDPISDLEWMAQNGLKQKIRQLEGDTFIFGVCGGYQMLGEQVEGNRVEEGEAEGLELIDMETSYSDDKNLEQVETEFRGTRLSGYRIHYGEPSTLSEKPLFEAAEKGFFDNVRRIAGTYIHNILSEPAFLSWLLEKSGVEAEIIDDTGLQEIEEELEPVVQHMISETF